MRPTVLTSILLLATGTAAHAQLSFLPQVGFEQNRSTLNYNNLATSVVDGNLRANLKMDYRFKGGHGPYVGVGTSPAPVYFAFNNAGALQESLEGVNNSMKLRLEAGYQYSSKPIQLGKGRSARSAASVESPNISSTQKKSCGSSTYKSSCGIKTRITKTTLVDNNLNMRIQPSVGLAYLPSTEESVKHTTNGFQYNATNWQTAIVPAVGFEFAKGRQRLFTLSVFYTKPLGLEDESVTTSTGTKPVLTTLSPKASTWGLSVGVPFSFADNNKVKTTKAKREVKKVYYKRCSKVQI